MKISIVHPPPSGKYEMPWSVEGINAPLQAAPALLARVLEEKVPGLNIQCIGDLKVNSRNADSYKYEYRKTEEIAESCEDSDIVGMSVFLSNLSKSLEIAKLLKKRNPKQTIILGGSGVNDILTPRLILDQTKFVDYIVRGDGEKPLIDIVNGKNPKDIPNFYFRRDGEVVTPTKKFVSNPRDWPIWDFKKTPDYQEVLKAWDSRTELYGELRKEHGNFIGMVGVLFSKGCEKAEEMGRCNYCVSSIDPKVVIGDAKKFWEQVLHLNKTHGITEYFIGDNVLAIPKKLDALLSARENFSVPDEIQFRAYGYVPHFRENGKEMMEKLKRMGTINLFLGVENFYKRINELSNKPGFEFEEVHNIVEQAAERGVDTFLPIMVGLPGDSTEALDYNIECMESLLRKFGKKKYGQGGLVRIDWSMAMPLRGSTWYNRLARNDRVLKYYSEKTGIDLSKHIDPDYDVLREASLKFNISTGLTYDEIDKYRKKFGEICTKYIRPEQIGGCDPTIRSGKSYV